jgi:hypothetical protein
MSHPYLPASRTAFRSGAIIFGSLLLGHFSARAALLTAPADSLAPIRPFVLTLSGGLNGPYGWGVDYGRRIAKHLDAGAGLGYDFCGLKAGVGARYYIGEDAKFATFVGANLSYCVGRDKVTVTMTDGGGLLPPETAQLDIHACVVGQIRVGLRWQAGQRLGFAIALGHGVVVGADPIQYLSPSNPSENIRSLVKARQPGGPELSLAVSMRLGHSDTSKGKYDKSRQ